MGRAVVTESCWLYLFIPHCWRTSCQYHCSRIICDNIRHFARKPISNDMQHCRTDSSCYPTFTIIPSYAHHHHTTHRQNPPERPKVQVLHTEIGLFLCCRFVIKMARLVSACLQTETSISSRVMTQNY